MRVRACVIVKTIVKAYVLEHVFFRSKCKKSLYPLDFEMFTEYLVLSTSTPPQSAGFLGISAGQRIGFESLPRQFTSPQKKPSKKV